MIGAESNGRPGRGFQIDVRNRTIVILFMGYRSDGAAAWYLASGTATGDTFTVSLDQYVGGTAFGAASKAAAPAGSAGNVRLKFTDPTRGEIMLPGEPAKKVSRLLGGGGGTGEMNTANTLSDRAQLATIAFDGLAFVTGSFCTQIAVFVGLAQAEQSLANQYGYARFPLA